MYKTVYVFALKLLFSSDKLIVVRFASNLAIFIFSLQPREKWKFFFWAKFYLFSHFSHCFECRTKGKRVNGIKSMFNAIVLAVWQCVCMLWGESSRFSMKIKMAHLFVIFIIPLIWRIFVCGCRKFRMYTNTCAESYFGQIRELQIGKYGAALWKHMW